VDCRHSRWFLQCVAVCCSVVYCVAVCCGGLQALSVVLVDFLHVNVRVICLF